MPDLGGVTVSVWYKPKSNGGISKVMLQGKAFMTFLAFGVPEILKDINSTVPSFLGFANSPLKTINTTKSSDDNKLVEKTDVHTLRDGFEKLQTEIVTLSENLTHAIDNSMAKVKEAVESMSTKVKLKN